MIDITLEEAVEQYLEAREDWLKKWEEACIRWGAEQAKGVIHNPLTGSRYPVREKIRSGKHVDSLWPKKEARAKLDEDGLASLLDSGDTISDPEMIWMLERLRPGSL